jgi:hypothetical protein
MQITIKTLTRGSLIKALDDAIVETLRNKPYRGYREIAQQFGCCSTYITKLAARHGIIRRSGRKSGKGYTAKVVV